MLLTFVSPRIAFASGLPRELNTAGHIDKPASANVFHDKFEQLQAPLLTPTLCPTWTVVYIPHHNSSWWELVDGGDWYRWIDGSSRGDICLFYFDRGYRDQLYIPAPLDSKPCKQYPGTTSITLSDPYPPMRRGRGAFRPFCNTRIYHVAVLQA